jgi:hypothetical protein
LFLCCCKSWAFWLHNFQKNKNRVRVLQGETKNEIIFSSMKWISKDFRNWLSAQFSKEQGEKSLGWNWNDHISSIEWAPKDFQNWSTLAQFSEEQEQGESL